MAEKIIIDTDPAIGVPLRDVDDGLALGLALKSPELEVLGITVTYGNTSLDRALRSARRVLAAAGREDVPILTGAPSAASLGKETEASRFLVETLAGDPGGVSLLTLGPLTNAATAEMLAPGTLRKAKRTVAMGGAVFGRGIMPPFFRAEFNFWKDPRASSVFVRSAGTLTIVPCELTMRVSFRWKYMKLLRDSGARLARFIYENSLSWYAASSAGLLRDGFPPHDPLAAGWMLRPDLFKTRETGLTVAENGISRGRTRSSLSGSPVSVADHVRENEFLDFLTERLCS